MNFKTIFPAINRPNGACSGFKRYLPILLFWGVANATPLTDFQLLAKRCKAALDARPAESIKYIKTKMGWVKTVNAPAKLAYDVRKTDSLVSPLIGYIEVTELTASETAPEEAVARTLPLLLDGGEGDIAIWRFNFAYQDRWEMIDHQLSRQSRPAPGEPFGKAYTFKSQAKWDIPEFIAFCKE